MGQIAFVFAGQGAQHPGMGKELYEVSPAARAAFDAAERLRPGTLEQCFCGTKEELGQTVNTQPCLFAVDYACAAALQERGVRADCAAGFSLGEVAAAAFCGMLPFEEAFRLVMRRAALMQRCAEARPGGMAAVLRLAAGQVEALCAPFDEVFPVNYNCPGQTVVSGSDAQLPAFLQEVAAQGGKAVKLAVSGAFHSPFMEKAAEGLLSELRTLALAPPRLPLYANATARPYEGDLAALLAGQAARPVLWQQTVENMQAAGASTFVEVGAGKTLSGLIKKIGGSKGVYQVEDAKSLRETAQALGGKAC